MKLEVVMYVRTLTLSGFSRIGKLEKIDDICITDNGAVDKTQIIKASNNIIDLLEVGDYVNGSKVMNIVEEDGTKYLVLDRDGVYCDSCLEPSSDKDIKSIVTKEQFESISYKVGD